MSGERASIAQSLIDFFQQVNYILRRFYDLARLGFVLPKFDHLQMGISQALTCDKPLKPPNGLELAPGGAGITTDPEI